MIDRYAQLARSRPGGLLAGRLGLPRPAQLERHHPGDPVTRGKVLLGGTPAGRLLPTLAAVLAEARVELATGPDAPLRALLAAEGIEASIIERTSPADIRLKALVFDASGISDSAELEALHGFLHPVVRRLARCGRVIVLADMPWACDSVREATAQRAIEGFTRSLGKEIGGGATVQLVQVAAGAEEGIASTIRFLLSPRSAFLSGQVIRVRHAVPSPQPGWEQPFAGKLALVTGASRGIGEATAGLLAAEGAQVVGLDVPALAGELSAAMDALGAEALVLDITAPDAPDMLAARFASGLDILVHNAGITRDRTLAKMPAERWRELMEVNLSSQERIDDELLRRAVLRENARIVCLSSMSAIAGNAGQTNYATSKAGIIGRVQALAPRLTDRAMTINAVAPGFIETSMTARMPIAIREAGRRMSSLSQGGLPVDVAEAIGWLAHPASGAINGSVIRVCGQNLLGA